MNPASPRSTGVQARSARAACALFVLALAWLPGTLVADAQGRWEADIARFEQADRVDPPAPGAVLFIGSSSIRFWDSLQTDFPGVRIIRRGFGGSTIREATRYVGRIVIPYRPRLVVLYAGDNDLAEGHTPDAVRDDFIAFTARVHRDLPDTAIAYIAIKPSPARAGLLDDAQRANRAIAAWMKTQHGMHFIDVATPMLDRDGRPRRELFGEDLLHMNRAGHELWIERIAPVLRDVATSSPARAGTVRADIEPRRRQESRPGRS